MSEHKSDEMTATGQHRAWTGETTGSTVRAGNPRDAQRSWLDRGSERSSSSSSSRHAAITRSLHSWSSYKSWTDKVRSTWDKDKNGK